MFFFKQKTAYEMRIIDWSSDVCSSDLDAALPNGLQGLAALGHVWIEAAIKAWIEHGRLAARESASAKKVQALEEQAIADGRYPFIDEWRETRLRALSDKLDQQGSRADDRRSEGRRVGKECVSTGRTRLTANNEKK